MANDWKRPSLGPIETRWVRLIQSMLSFDPEQRIRIGEVLVEIWRLLVQVTFPPADPETLRTLDFTIADLDSMEIQIEEWKQNFNFNKGSLKFMI